MKKEEFELAMKHLDNLSDAYSQSGDARRATAFSSAKASIVSIYNEDNLPFSVDVLEKLRGVGKSTVQEIKEVLLTGTSKRLRGIQAVRAAGTATADIFDSI